MCTSSTPGRADPGPQGEMTITITLVDAGGGTDILAVHDGLPGGLSLADNEARRRASPERVLPEPLARRGQEA